MGAMKFGYEYNFNEPIEFFHCRFSISEFESIRTYVIYRNLRNLKQIGFLQLKR